MSKDTLAFMPFMDTRLKVLMQEHRPGEWRPLAILTVRIEEFEAALLAGWDLTPRKETPE